MKAALQQLKAKFGRVVYVPGNHDLWIKPGIEQSIYPDSFAKLFALRQVGAVLLAYWLWSQRPVTVYAG